MARIGHRRIPVAYVRCTDVLQGKMTRGFRGLRSLDNANVLIVLFSGGPCRIVRTESCCEGKNFDEVVDFVPEPRKDSFGIE